MIKLLKGASAAELELKKATEYVKATDKKETAKNISLFDFLKSRK